MKKLKIRKKKGLTISEILRFFNFHIMNPKNAVK